MVDFLLHNSLGAWWVTRHPGKTCPVTLTYLRTLEDGTPAAGKFEGWPDRLEEFKLLDPCCGSGHFLVAAFLLLVPMRMAAEGLSAMDAVDAVLADNLHGLELDARCVEIAVFALALAAWRFPDENGDPLGVRADMPAPQVACCGLKVVAKPEDWMALVPDDAPNAAYLRQELRLLYASFAQAPVLGSLLDPARSLKNDLATSSFETLRDLLGRALSTERPTTLWGQANELQDDSWDLALTAKGLLDAARLLDGRYHLVVTNVPYLARGKQHDTLKDYCEAHYPEAKNDLANVFLERCLELSRDQSAGVVQIVMPQNWLFLPTYERLRLSLFNRTTWLLVAQLGAKAFQTPMWDFNVQLLTLAKQRFNPLHRAAGVDVGHGRDSREKSQELEVSSINSIAQAVWFKNPASAVTFVDQTNTKLLSDYVEVHYGSKPGQTARVTRCFWEVLEIGDFWSLLESSPSAVGGISGKSEIIYSIQAMHANQIIEFGLRSADVLGKKGFILSKMNSLPLSQYLGNLFDDNTYVITIKNPEQADAVFCYLLSDDYRAAVRARNQKLAIDTGSMINVPFDFEEWASIAKREFARGVPLAESSDPTQWLFHGHPQTATDPLQVAVARLAGYRWPAETDT